MGNSKKKKKKKGQVEAITTTPAKKESKYDKFLKTPGLQTVAGSFITLHKTGDKLYFEMPLKYMGRELLIASVVSETSNPDITTVEEAKNAILKIWREKYGKSSGNAAQVSAAGADSENADHGNATGTASEKADSTEKTAGEETTC